jgi:phosphoglycolate phosphatase
VTRYRLVHFDLDGTLLDTRADLTDATNHVRRSFGLDPLAPEAVQRLVGHGARVLVERALGPERADLHDQGVRRLLEWYGAHCLDRTHPYPGLVEAIDALAVDGVRFTVLTNKPEALTRKILRGLDLERRFIGVVGGDTFPERKPDPRGAEHLRAIAGAECGDCLLVGDSSVDVATARAARIDCCGALWGFDPEGVRAAKPDHLVSTARELVPLVRRGSAD